MYPINKVIKKKLINLRMLLHEAIFRATCNDKLTKALQDKLHG